MKSSVRLGKQCCAAALFALIAGACSSQTAVSPPLNGASADIRATTGNATGPLLYAYLPSSSSIAAFPLSASGKTAPTKVLQGKRTQLAAGNAFGIDSAGRPYVLSGSPVALHVFGNAASGNARPAQTRALPNSLYPGQVTGFAFDGQGNFWTVNQITKGLVYRFSVTDSSTPNVTIAPTIPTPSGTMRVSPSAVAVGPNGHVFVLGNVLANHGDAHGSGVSEYAVDSQGHAKRVRSFIDLAMELEGTLAVDGRGNVYVASEAPSDATQGIWVFSPKTPSGSVSSARHIYGKFVENVRSILVDSKGLLYVAEPGQIAVFSSTARDKARPLRIISNASYLNFAVDGNFGTLLAIQEP